jgi:hypothetical protein
LSAIRRSLKDRLDRALARFNLILLEIVLELRYSQFQRKRDRPFANALTPQGIILLQYPDPSNPGQWVLNKTVIGNMFADPQYMAVVNDSAERLTAACAKYAASLSEDSVVQLSPTPCCLPPQIVDIAGLRGLAAGRECIKKMRDYIKSVLHGEGMHWHCACSRSARWPVLGSTATMVL